MPRPTPNQSAHIADAASGPVAFLATVALTAFACLALMDLAGIPAFEVAGAFIRGAFTWLTYVAVVLAVIVSGAACLGAAMGAER